MLFSRKNVTSSSRHPDFAHIPEDVLYFDSACQTQRPASVIAAMSEYYTSYNSCGGRVKYSWGVRVDEEIADTKRRILSLLGKKESEYVVSFTLNTTMGINQVLSQIPSGVYKEVLTSEIEHNSVFLPTIALSKRLNIPRRILPRASGAVQYEPEVLSSPLALVNNVSNIDGQACINLDTFSEDIHAHGGILLIDAAQGILQDSSLSKIPFDALFFSGHKIYGPSIGIIVIKRTLLQSLTFTQLGGGMVQDVHADAYTLLSGEHAASLLELGLQDYAAIIGLREALIWTEKHYRHAHIKALASQFREWLRTQSHIHIVGDQESSVVTIYSDIIDSHKLAIYCSEQNIMARSGAFCCHYYINDVAHLPPLLRFSFGAHNTQHDVERLISILTTLFTNIQ